MRNTFFIGFISWFLPGVGHWMCGRRQRAIILGTVVWGLFVIAVLSGGLFYPGFEFKDGALLYLLNILARAGNGLGMFIGYILMGAPPANVAAWATFEYGGRFLEVAGLLNFLAAIDAVDINLRRKE